MKKRQKKRGFSIGGSNIYEVLYIRNSHILNIRYIRNIRKWYKMGGNKI